MANNNTDTGMPTPRPEPPHDLAHTPYNYDWPAPLRAIHEACSMAYAASSATDDAERALRRVAQMDFGIKQGDIPDGAEDRWRQIERASVEAYHTWRELEALGQLMLRRWQHEFPELA